MNNILEILEQAHKINERIADNKKSCIIISEHKREDGFTEAPPPRCEFCEG